MQGLKNAVKLMVSATLVGSPRKKHSKTNGFGISGSKMQQKHMLFWYSWSHVQKRSKNQCFFDALIPCAQNTSKTNAFWTQGYKTTVKLMVLVWAPNQSCSNAIKTNAFLMQSGKNRIKLMVSATLVGSPRCSSCCSSCSTGECLTAATWKAMRKTL